MHVHTEGIKSKGKKVFPPPYPDRESKREMPLPAFPLIEVR